MRAQELRKTSPSYRMKPKELAREKVPKYKKTFSHTPKKNNLLDIQDADEVPEPHIGISATSLSRSSVTLMNHLSSLQQQQEMLSHKLMMTVLDPQLSFGCE